VAKDSRVRYSPAAVIKVEDMAALEGAVDKAKAVRMLTPDGKVPANAPFFVTVTLPAYRPMNLVPRKKDSEPIESTLLIGALVFDTPLATKPVAVTKMAVGVPVNHPQRSHKLRRVCKHQTFEFAPPAGGFTAAAKKAVLRLYTLHAFYEKSKFGDRRQLIWSFEFDVA